MSKEKHLEFIQGVINRHNSNSFMLKGWSITIVSALYALAGSVNQFEIALIAISPIIIFWGLDSFYLSNERCFVDLYNAVATDGYKIPKSEMFKEDFGDNIEDIDEGKIPLFNMNFKKFKIWKDNKWAPVLKSKSIFWFYFPMILITLLVSALLFFSNPQKALDVNATLKQGELELKLESEPPTIINKVQPNIYIQDTTTKK